MIYIGGKEMRKLKLNLQTIFAFIAVVGIILAIFVSSCDAPKPKPKSSTEVSNENNEAIALAAQLAYPTPMVTNFNERKVLDQYIRYFDKPGVITYVYLYSFGVFIDYFICGDKPISTRSYMEPEERYYMNGALIQTPSLDGTWGQDNIGWIFKRDDGTIGSWQGSGANLLFFTEKPTPDRHARLISAGVK